MQKFHNHCRCIIFSEPWRRPWGEKLFQAPLQPVTENKKITLVMSHEIQRISYSKISTRIMCSSKLLLYVIRT